MITSTVNTLLKATCRNRPDLECMGTELCLEGDCPILKPCTCGDRRALIVRSGICPNCKSRRKPYSTIRSTSSGYHISRNKHVPAEAGLCYACERSGLPLENHHVLGPAHPETAPLCISCHLLVTRLTRPRWVWQESKGRVWKHPSSEVMLRVLELVRDEARKMFRSGAYAPPRRSLSQGFKSMTPR